MAVQHLMYPAPWIVPVSRLIYSGDLSARSYPCSPLLRTLHHSVRAQMVYEFRFQHSAAQDE